MRHFAQTTLLWTGLTLLWAQPAPQPRFEVASIKPSPPGLPREYLQDGGTDHFTAHYVSVRRLISIGFHVYDHQIEGGPSWMGSTYYDIEAKAPGKMDWQRSEQMVQSLLTDRFQLKFHHETREQPVLDLVVAKGGHKLGEPDPTKRNYFREGALTAHNARIEFLANSLTFLLGKTVIDKTGLDGKFNYDLKWTPEDAAGALEGISLFTAIQEQLGLKLEARKGPVEVLVVDRVEKPSDN